MKNESGVTLQANRLGIIASAACFVHCILTPVALSLLPVWVHSLPSEENVHRFLAVGVAGLGGFALIGGYRRHRRSRIFLLMGSGLLLIFAGAYFGDRLPSHLAEVAVTMTGSFSMIAAHLLNHTFCRDCEGCKEPPCQPRP